ncbi:uncharacterized protein VNE69_11121 [Vairimorpha necatrix]|uniref:Uncharacterized protein n=1 Tax=Vairimorpha necatrix TaxID=6039 RepID=A0AAX4JG41_9MICR
MNLFYLLCLGMRGNTINKKKNHKENNRINRIIDQTSTQEFPQYNLQLIIRRLGDKTLSNHIYINQDNRDLDNQQRDVERGREMQLMIDYYMNTLNG